MNRLRALWDSSVGKKAVMAVTGVIGVLFVIGHMVGNLQVFQGAERLNAYGALLHGPLNEILWAVRVILVLAVILHVVAAVQLTLRDRAARPVGYARRVPQVSTLASRTMRWGGALLLVFIVVHILHFTTGTIRPAGTFVPGDVYANMVAGFRIPWVATFYVVSMGALGLHLYHGAWSSMRSLGAAPASPHPLTRRLAAVIAVFVSVGFALVPLAVVAGWVGGAR
ncbi:MAG TPA: succinate dehydrogenase cytochrome b subunit [Gemmatimonadales bacterium]|jgi:succinate dehydrogenase / fumarate reductase cytochrome b subunit